MSNDVKFLQNGIHDMSVSDVSPEKLEELAVVLQEHAKKLRSGSGIGEKEHGALVATFWAVEDALYTPMDDLLSQMVKMVRSISLRLFIKWKVFEHIPMQGAISYDELAGMVKAETNLIRRFAWALVAAGILRQEGSNSVAHTERSRVYASLNPVSAFACIGFDDHFVSYARMPRYFDEFGLKEPTDYLQTPSVYVEDKLGMSIWEMHHLDPERSKRFMLAMEAAGQRFPSASLYDFSWIVAKGKESPDRVLVADVGGGKGHMLKDICKLTTGLEMSRCALEDLPAVNEETKKMGDQDVLQAKIVDVDFHKGQPIKGACVYHMRRILHDYSDEACINILKHISAAMAPDSKLLIFDKVMGNPPDPLAAASDLLMMNISGKERTVDLFREIAGKAGLKVTRMFGGENLFTSAVECEKA